MAILLDRLLDKITVKILNGPTWSQDKETVKEIPNSRFNGTTKLWEVPYGQIGDFFTRWPKHDILWHNPKIQRMYDAWQNSLIRIEELPNVTAPPGWKFCRELWPHQLRAVLAHHSKRRILLAYEMGLGKSITALERVRLLGYQRLLIVCPKVVRTNWRTAVREVLKNEAPIYIGTKPQRAKLMEELKKIQVAEHSYNSGEVHEISKSVVICTFETLAEINSAIADGIILAFDHLIIDEAHLASNPETKTFKDCDRLTNWLCESAGLQCLTGTPMRHRIRDIWGILYLLNPYYAGSREAFLSKYEQITKVIKKRLPVVRNGKQVYDTDGKPKFWVKEIPTRFRPINIELLRDYLNCVMFRQTREGITTFRDEPKIVTVEMTPSQRRLYERVRDEVLVEVGDKTLNLKEQLARTGRLLQVSEGLHNFEGTKKESAKLEYCQFLMEQSIAHFKATGERRKILFWSRFEPTTRALQEMSGGHGVIYSGKVSDKRKDLAKWAFNGVDDEKDREIYQDLRAKIDWPFDPGDALFFFATIDMRSALGMELHKQCHHQVFTSFSWEGAADLQAADRLRRIGQDAAEVFTEFLVAENTFEEKALTLVLSNYATTINALDGTSALSYSTIAQIIDILRNDK